MFDVDFLVDPSCETFFRQDLQDLLDYLYSVYTHHVHPVDPVRKIKLHFVKFLSRSDWTLAASAGDQMEPSDDRHGGGIYWIGVWQSFNLQI